MHFKVGEGPRFRSRTLCWFVEWHMGYPWQSHRLLFYDDILNQIPMTTSLVVSPFYNHLGSPWLLLPSGPCTLRCLQMSPPTYIVHEARNEREEERCTLVYKRCAKRLKGWDCSGWRMMMHWYREKLKVCSFVWGQWSLLLWSKKEWSFSDGAE